MRLLAFAGNDRPGIMLASAARSYLHRHAVLAGREVVLFTTNDSAYAVALDLADAGARVRSVVGARRRSLTLDTQLTIAGLVSEPAS